MVRRALEAKGGREVGYARYHGAGIFLGYAKHGYQFSPNHPRYDEIAARLAGRVYAKQEYDAQTPAIYRLERFLTNRLFIRHLYTRLFLVNKKKCNACGLCMKLCPMKNIAQDRNGRPVWGRNCIGCYACEMRCPKDAIGSPVVWFLFWPFIAYNVRTAAADPALDQARVRHANGRMSIIE
jgi:NAD-dependent dihydropyrimidine dehydrogenase PreA subunit